MSSGYSRPQTPSMLVSVSRSFPVHFRGSTVRGMKCGHSRRQRARAGELELDLRGDFAFERRQTAVEFLFRGELSDEKLDLGQVELRFIDGNGCFVLINAVDVNLFATFFTLLRLFLRNKATLGQ